MHLKLIIVSVLCNKPKVQGGSIENSLHFEVESSWNMISPRNCMKIGVIDIIYLQIICQ